MLYSRQTNQWKIADFGISSQATSKRGITSRFARGTDSYYAPELLAPLPKFTNKVDMWALGCILYELMTGSQAFSDSWAIFEYSRSEYKLALPNSSIPESLRSHLSENINELLHRNPATRPSALDACRTFQAYCAVLNDSLIRIIDECNLFPPYVQWKKLSTGPQTQKDLLLSLARWYQSAGNHNATVMSVELLTSQRLDDQKFTTQITDTDVDTKIVLWEELANEDPNNWKVQGELAKALIERGDIDLAIARLKDHMERNYSVGELCSVLRQACKEKGGVDEVIAEFRNLVDTHPGNYVMARELAEACTEKGDVEEAVAIWMELVRRHPNSKVLAEHWVKAWSTKPKKDEMITELKKLVERHPDSSVLTGELGKAWNEDIDDGIEWWKMQRAKHSNCLHLTVELGRALQKRADHRRAQGDLSFQ